MPKPELKHDPDSPPGEELEAAGRSLFNLFPGWHFMLSGMTDSTNGLARRESLRLGGAAWARVFLADFQVGGKGRMGRKWQAPPRTSLLCTVMVPRTSFQVPQQTVPVCTGVWMREGLLRCGVSREAAKLKWPNDLLVDGKKIGGILCETAGDALLIGVGVNLDQDAAALPERLIGQPPATSLKIELGDQYTGRLVTMITLTGALLEAIENPGKLEDVMSEYRKQCATVGQEVDFDDPLLGRTRGKVEDLDETGALLVNVPEHGRRIVTNLALPDSPDEP